MISPDQLHRAKLVNLLELIPKDRAVKPHGKGWKVRCMFHDDTKPSMSLYKHEDGTWRYKCFACGEWGDPVQYIRKTKEMSLTEAVQFLTGEAEQAPEPKKPIATYDYVSGQGELLYQVCRFEPKEFRCRRPVESLNGTGWTWDMCGVTRVLYRLPKLLELEPGSVVYYVEGEKDVQTLERLGLVGTTHANGSGAFRAELLDPIKHLGIRLVVIPDMDEPGKQLMRRVYAAGNERKMNTGFILLSDWKHGMVYANVQPKDVTDFFQAGGTVPELVALTK